MKTSNNWFDRDTRPIWDQQLKPIRDEFNKYLEIGSCEGASVCYAFDELEIERAVCVDPFIAPHRKHREAFATYLENFLENTKQYGDKIRLWKESSWQFFCGGWHQTDNPTALIYDDGDFDLIYIDGAHDAPTVMADAIHCWPLLRVGGVMIFDDYNRRFHRQQSLVRPAVTSFRMCFDTTWDVLYETQRQIGFTKVK